MKNNRLISLFILLTMIFSLSSIEVGATTNPEIAVGQVTALPGGVVSVPITLSGNAGICGATISVHYDTALILTGIDKGEGLSSLTMTKPGNLSANPVNIVWDGMEEDKTNGIIATLTFTAPNITGTYPIAISYEEGDILDGNISPVDVSTKEGSIAVREDNSGPILSVSNVTATKGISVSVPITLSGNTGICGATISVHYDTALILTGIDKGSGLSSLTMTKPGDFSANPVKIVWDGMEEDKTNGIIATLTFIATNTPGTYAISLSYDDGDILDGNISPVDVEIKQGKVEVKSSMTINVEIASNKVIMTNESENIGEIIIAYYESTDKLFSVVSYDPGNGDIKIDNVSNDVAYAKVMWWDSLKSLKPLCESKKIDFE